MKKCKKVKCLYTNTLRYNIYKKVSNVFAGGITKKALHVGVEPFVICFCKTFVKY